MIRPGAAVLLLSVTAACGGTSVPSVPSPLLATPPTVGSASASLQVVTLGEAVGVTLDATVAGGGSYCEIGGDPAPCARFSIDVPRAGALLLRMDSDTADPMFLYLYRRDPPLGIVVDLQHMSSDRSPMLVRQQVERGTVYLHAGLNVPWGRREGQMRLRILATLE